MKPSLYERAFKSLVLTTVLVALLVFNLNEDRALSTIILIGCVYSLGCLVLYLIRESKCSWLEDRPKPYNWAEDEDDLFF